MISDSDFRTWLQVHRSLATRGDLPDLDTLEGQVYFDAWLTWIGAQRLTLETLLEVTKLVAHQTQGSGGHPWKSDQLASLKHHLRAVQAAQAIADKRLPLEGLKLLRAAGVGAGILLVAEESTRDNPWAPELSALARGQATIDATVEALKPRLERAQGAWHTLADRWRGEKTEANALALGRATLALRVRRWGVEHQGLPAADLKATTLYFAQYHGLAWDLDQALEREPSLRQALLLTDPTLRLPSDPDGVVVSLTADQWQVWQRVHWDDRARLLAGLRGPQADAAREWLDKTHAKYTAGEQEVLAKRDPAAYAAWAATIPAAWRLPSRSAA